MNREKAKARGSCNDLRGLIPESWACIDCGVNTAPGLVNRAQAEQAFANYDGRGIKQTVGESSEVYTVTPDVWQAAGMEPAILNANESRSRGCAWGVVSPEYHRLW